MLTRKQGKARDRIQRNLRRRKITLKHVVQQCEAENITLHDFKPRSLSEAMVLTYGKDRDLRDSHPDTRRRKH
jgi:hypothetical protein